MNQHTLQMYAKFIIFLDIQMILLYIKKWINYFTHHMVKNLFDALYFVIILNVWIYFLKIDLKMEKSV